MRSVDRQGRQPGQPLRRDQALRREALRRRATPTPRDSPARFACVRYGNVVGSRGCVIPLFRRQAADRRADDHRRAHDALLDHARRRRSTSCSRCAGQHGRRRDLRPEDPVDAHDRPGRPRSRPTPSSRSSASGPGEKLHEVLITEDESRHAIDVDFGYVIQPEYASWTLREHHGTAGTGELPLRLGHERCAG